MHTLIIMLNAAFKEKWLELQCTNKKIMNACICVITNECIKVGVVVEKDNIMF